MFYIGPVEPEQQTFPAPNHTVVDNNLSNGKLQLQHSGGNGGKRRKNSRLWDENVSEFRFQQWTGERTHIVCSARHKLGTSKPTAETRHMAVQGRRWWQWPSKTLIRKVAKAFQGNPGMSEPSFSINSHISRIQTQFYQALYRGLLIDSDGQGFGQPLRVKGEGW